MHSWNNSREQLINSKAKQLKLKPRITVNAGFIAVGIPEMKGKTEASHNKLIKY